MRLSLRSFKWMMLSAILWTLQAEVSAKTLHHHVVDGEHKALEAEEPRQLPMFVPKSQIRRTLVGKNIENAAEQSAPTIDADILIQQGIDAFQNSQYQKTIELWQAALEIYRGMNHQQGEAGSLRNLGFVYYRIGEYQKAIDFQQQALSIFRETGDRLDAAVSLNYLGFVSHRIGEYRQAIDFQQQALSIFRETDSRPGEINSLTSFGIIYYSLGKYEQALDSHQQALAIAREINDRQSESNSLGNLGNVYERLGEYEQAIDFQQQSLAIDIELGDRLGEAASLGNLGNIHKSLGKYEQAIDFHQRSLAIDRKLGDYQGQADSLGNLGNVYEDLGEYEQAIYFHKQQLAIAREIDDRAGEANALGNLGIAYYSLRDYGQAIAFQQQSLAIKKEIEDRPGEANSLGSIGNIYFRRGEYERAIDFLQQQLAITREISDRPGEANSLGNLGNIYFGKGDYQKSADFYQQSLAIKREIGDRPGEANTLTNLGISYLTQNLAVMAEDTLFEAISTYEDLQAAELPDQNRISFFDMQISAYRNLETALVAQSKFETALEISERGRTRAFVQLLSERLSAEFANQRNTQSSSFKEIQRIAKAQNSTIVEYSISSSASGNGTSLHIWLIQPTGELHFQEVPVDDSLTGVVELVQQSREALNTRGRGGFIATNTPTEESDATARLRELHQLLIEPIAELLPNDLEQRVVFIPQGELFLVPFPALQDESGTYLIEQYTILTAPSIQVFDLTRQQSTTIDRSTTSTEILTVGNPVMPEVRIPERNVSTQLPTLIGAEQEAKAIANFFNTEALIGAQATEQAIKEQISNAGIVHLATHGLLEYGIPEESGVRDVPGAIALTPTATEDGLLTAAEILELDLQAELVVLSACDTGLGRVTGDGVIGLSRSLIAAGTPSVIVSLWSIPDAPTAELMVEFYRQMQQGKDKAQALRQAMLITKETHPNPRDWAAFTLIGEAN